MHDEPDLTASPLYARSLLVNLNMAVLAYSIGKLLVFSNAGVMDLGMIYMMSGSRW